MSNSRDFKNPFSKKDGEKVIAFLSKEKDGIYSNSQMASLVSQLDCKASDLPKGGPLFFKAGDRIYGIEKQITRNDIAGSVIRSVYDLASGEHFIMKSRYPAIAIKNYRGSESQLKEDLKSSAETEINSLRAAGNNTSELFTKQDNDITEYHFTTEFATGLTLEDIMDDEFYLTPLNALIYDIKLTVDDLINIMQQIADQLVILQEKGYYHGDIAPGNIKFDYKTGKAKLVDFGSASPIDPITQEAKFPTQTTPNYSDPKKNTVNSTGFVNATQGFGKSTQASEVFSFGKVFSEIYDHPNFPFEQNNDLDDLLTDLMQIESKDRPTFQQVQQALLNIRMGIPLPPINVITSEKEEAVGLIPQKQEITSKVEVLPQEQFQEARIEAENNVWKDYYERENFEKVRDALCRQLDEIGKFKISPKRQKDYTEFQTAAGQLLLTPTVDTLRMVFAKLVIFFNDQCGDYGKSFFSFRNKDPIADVLNIDLNNHHLTRGVGSILQNFIADENLNKYLSSHKIKLEEKIHVNIRSLKNNLSTLDTNLKLSNKS